MPCFSIEGEVFCVFPGYSDALQNLAYDIVPVLSRSSWSSARCTHFLGYGLFLNPVIIHSQHVSKPSQPSLLDEKLVVVPGNSTVEKSSPVTFTEYESHLWITNNYLWQREGKFTVLALTESQMVISSFSRSFGSTLVAAPRPSFEYALVFVSRSMTLNRSICCKMHNSKLKL